MSARQEADPVKPAIRYEPGQLGGVLKYFGEQADAGYWDDLWSGLDLSREYARAEKGHIPWQLRATLLRWIAPGSRVLEAGCGLATFTIAMHARGFKAEGVDYAPNVLERVRVRFPQVPLFEGDVRRLTGIADGTYDAVYSPGVCEHFEEGPAECLLEARRVLRRGGILAVSTPCFNDFHRMMVRLGGLRAEPAGSFYQYAFSIGGMRDILRRLGFEVLQTRPYGTLLTLTTQMPALARIRWGPLRNPLAVALDTLPITRRWGHSCLWIARRS